MAQTRNTLTLGLPRMHKERGERRDFLPSLAGRLKELGVEVYAESGIGSGVGLTDADYAAQGVHLVEHAEAYRQDVVLVLRAPELDELSKLKRGATLISMLHFPTRPRRIRRLTELGLEALSLDSIADDEGRRLVENMRAVAWNGLEVAFQGLQKTDATLEDPARPPVRVTVMGVGMVGKHAVEAATKYGSLERAKAYRQRKLLGVEVTVLGRNLTHHWPYMKERLRLTDVLVDATQRTNPSVPLIPNAWLAWLPSHAVICDLVVDPYVLEASPPTVRSVEGIPRGDLDQYLFLADDPGWHKTIPAGIATQHRRAVASCYSWPGVHPKECMQHYEEQLTPLLVTLFQRGGVQGLRPDGDFFERALCRASLRAWRRGSGPEVDGSNELQE